MAVWLIQADLSFLRAAKERLGQSIAEAEQGARSWIDGRSSSNPLPDDNGSKKAAGIEGSDQRCEGTCPEQPSATAARAPRKLVVSVDTSGMATGREAAEIMISGMDVCPAGRVCQGIVSFEAGTVGKYTMIGTSPSSTTLIPADRFLVGVDETILARAREGYFTDADLQHVTAALEAMELVVVQDLFLNETAKFAHVFLPGTSFLEKDGTFTNAERRINRVRPVFGSRVGKDEWQVVCEIAQAMGHDMRFESAAAIMDEVAATTPTFAGVSFARLDAVLDQRPGQVTARHHGQGQPRHARQPGQDAAVVHRQVRLGDSIAVSRSPLLGASLVQHHHVVDIRRDEIVEPVCRGSFVHPCQRWLRFKRIEGDAKELHALGPGHRSTPLLAEQRIVDPFARREIDGKVRLRRGFSAPRFGDAGCIFGGGADLCQQAPGAHARRRPVGKSPRHSFGSGGAIATDQPAGIGAGQSAILRMGGQPFPIDALGPRRAALCVVGTRGYEIAIGKIAAFRGGDLRRADRLGRALRGEVPFGRREQRIATGLVLRQDTRGSADRAFFPRRRGDSGEQGAGAHIGGIRHDRRRGLQVALGKIVPSRDLAGVGRAFFG